MQAIDGHAEEEAMLVSCILDAQKTHNVTALLDNGIISRSEVLFDTKLAHPFSKDLGISLQPLPRARQTFVYDGRRDSIITHTFSHLLQVFDHFQPSTLLFVTPPGHHQLILGKR
jgi:hypothetical protein